MTGREELERRVLEALGKPCEVCAGTVRFLLAHPFDRQAFDHAATTLGFRNRQALSRRIQKHRFPPPHALQDWLRLVIVVATAERTSLSLQVQAYDHGLDPSTLHRTIARVGQARWSKLRSEGVEGLLRRLASSIGARTRCGRK